MLLMCSSGKEEDTCNSWRWCFVYDVFTLRFGLFYVQIALLSGSRFPCTFIKINHSIKGMKFLASVKWGGKCYYI